jgi:hypothetical protein
MTVTVVLLLSLTLWLTSFKTMSVTITKPADTDPPFLIRGREPIELEGIADDGGNIYRQPEAIQITCISKDSQAIGGEVLQGGIHISVDPVSKRFRQRVWLTPMVPHESAYLTVSGVQDRAGRWLNSDHRLLTTNIVRVRVE